MSKIKLFFINPAWSHNVFRWWQYFFNEKFNFFVLNHWEKSSQIWNFIKLTPKKFIKFFKNFIVFYDKSRLWVEKNDIVIIWDIFTNTLSYTFNEWNIIYYSEYFNYKKNIIKKFIFYFIGYLFFYNKKFIVSTTLSKNTFKKISNNVLYFPVIYYWTLNKSLKNEFDEINLLFVWRISQKFKNIDFLIDNYIELCNKHDNLKSININIVWKIYDSKYFCWSNYLLKKYNIKYLWEKNQVELLDIYQNSDIFILPSNSDPIWAVVLESMANSCAVLVSDTVWASCYIENWKNWFIFKTNDKNDFQFKLYKLLSDTILLKMFKYNSYSIVKSNFRYLNTELLEFKNDELNYFFNEK